MERVYLYIFIICSLFIWQISAAADSQTWTVRSGDNLDMIASTLEIPKQEIAKENPKVSESNLQIGQKLNLPLRSYTQTRALEEQLVKKNQWIGELERRNSDLEKKMASTESQLRWNPIWLWGFWFFFGIIAFIVCGAYWIFRQTHPRVFEPHDRSIRDLKESQIRLRSSFVQDDERVSSHGGQWQPSLKRLHAHR